MFDIGWNELLLIVMVAIVVIGPKDLPRVMRTVGQWTNRLKRMGREFQGQFNEALREAELDGVRDDIANVRKDLVAIGTNIKDDVTKTGAEINKGLQVNEPAATAPAAAAAVESASATATETAAAEPATVPETKSPVDAAPAFEALPTQKPEPVSEAPVPAETPAPVPEPVAAVAPQAEAAAVAAGEVKP